MSKEKMIDPGFIQFFDNETPGLTAGKYILSSTLSLPNADTDHFTTTVTKEFQVAGPQFSLDPTEIHAMFPASEANGDFSRVLPNIILENPVLPWERTLIHASPSTPWMAVLVFRAHEIEVNSATNSPLITTTVADFLKPETGIIKPNIKPDKVAPGILNSSMNSIRISKEVFQAVTPRLEELHMLVHVREVNIADQAANDMGTDSWFSVILANRFPQSSNESETTGVVNYAHLVSMEGWSDYMIDNPQWPADAEKVQLVSLASWRFVSARQQGATFSELAMHLIDAAGSNSSTLLLRIDKADDGSAAAKRLKEGYTALRSHVVTGEDTFCWYRGPFSAVRPQPLPDVIKTYSHPSAAMIYDQAHAIFDHSYATAWSIGQLAALSDPVFVDLLQRVRTRIIQVGNRLLERSFIPHLAEITDLRQLASPGLTRKFFASQVEKGMGEMLTRSFDEPIQRETISKTVRRNNLYPNEEIPVSPGEEMLWFFNKAEISAFLLNDITEELDLLATWLADLALLYNVPFNHLVADQRMLPVESIRFFHVDKAWLQVLLDGALRVGVHGTKGELANRIFLQSVLEKTLEKINNERSRLLGVTQSDPTTEMPAAGLLLRSALVSGWPGLSVNAKAGGAPVEIMRMDLVAPSILLVLWKVVPDKITIGLPEQALAFGVNDNYTITRRSLAKDNLGAQLPAPVFPASGNFNKFMRAVQNNTGDMVLKLIPPIAGGTDYIVPALANELSVPTITASQFAIEMVRIPEQIVFNPPA